MSEIETLAENIVEAGHWLPFEVYKAWVLEQSQPQQEATSPSSISEDASTVRPPQLPKAA